MKDSKRLVDIPWVMDSGASFHMCSDLLMFDTFKPCNDLSDDIVLTNGSECGIMGKGTVKFEMLCGSVRTLSNVMYIPSMDYNLISLGTLDSQRYKVWIVEQETIVMKGSELFMVGVRNYNNDLYYLVSKTFMRNKQICGLLENNKDENTVDISSWRKNYKVDQPTVHKDDQSSKPEAFSASWMMVKPVRQWWLMDSGANVHVCPNQMLFDSFTPCQRGVVDMPNGDRCGVAGRGSVTLELPGGLVRALTDVFYMPSATLNVISLPALASKGYKILMKDGKMRVFKGSVQVMVAKRTYNMLYYLDSKTFMRYEQKDSIRSRIVRLFRTVAKRVKLKFGGE